MPLDVVIARKATTTIAQSRPRLGSGRSNAGWSHLRFDITEYSISVSTGRVCRKCKTSNSPIIHFLNKRVYSQRTKRWFEQMWLAHMVHAFRNPDLKVYVDGEPRNDVVIGGSSGGMTVRLPGEGRYYLAFHLNGFKGQYTPGRFGGHTLEFDAGGRAVRIESSGTFGFGSPRQVFMLGPSQAGQ